MGSSDTQKMSELPSSKAQFMRVCDYFSEKDKTPSQPEALLQHDAYRKYKHPFPHNPLVLTSHHPSFLPQLFA
jgi:hypothetical protein